MLLLSLQHEARAAITARIPCAAARAELHCGERNTTSSGVAGEKAKQPEHGHARRFCAQVVFIPPESPERVHLRGESRQRREASALTYARARLHGVAGEEADLLRRQDFALQPQKDNGVRCAWPTLRAHNSGTISRQKTDRRAIYEPWLSIGGVMAGGKEAGLLSSFLLSFLPGWRLLKVQP